MIAFGASLWFGACAPSATCPAGPTQACTCLGGGPAVQMCLADNSGYGPCAPCPEPCSSANPSGACVIGQQCFNGACVSETMAVLLVGMWVDTTPPDSAVSFRRVIRFVAGGAYYHTQTSLYAATDPTLARCTQTESGSGTWISNEGILNITEPTYEDARSGCVNAGLDGMGPIGEPSRQFTWRVTDNDLALTTYAVGNMLVATPTTERFTRQ